jgi:hypothetical protein
MPSTSRLLLECTAWPGQTVAGTPLRQPPGAEEVTPTRAPADRAPASRRVPPRREGRGPGARRARVVIRDGSGSRLPSRGRARRIVAWRGGDGCRATWGPDVPGAPARARDLAPRSPDERFDSRFPTRTAGLVRLRVR